MSKIKFLSFLHHPLIKDSLGVGITKFMAIPVGLALSVLLARLLGPEGYGQYAFVVSFLTVVSLFIAGGLTQLLTREIALARVDSEWPVVMGIIRCSSLWAGAASVAVVAALLADLLPSAQFGNPGKHELMIVGCLSIPALCLNTIWSAVLRGFGRVVQSQLPFLLLAPFVQLALVGLLIGCKLVSPLSIVSSYVATYMIILVIGLCFVRRNIPADVIRANSVYRLRPWSRSWVSFTFLALAGMLNMQVGVLLLGYISTDSAVGSFQIADRGAQFVGLALGIIELAMAPYIARCYQAGSMGELQRLSLLAARIATVSALIASLPIFIFGRSIIELVFGAAYVDQSLAPLLVLTAAQFLKSLFGPVGMALTMTGREKQTLYAYLAALVINITAAILLIPEYGAAGAAIASALGVVACVLFMAFMVVKGLGIRPSII